MKRNWTALNPALEKIFAASWAYTDDPVSVRLARWAHGDRIRIAAIYRPALLNAGRKSSSPTTTRRG